MPSTSTSLELTEPVITAPSSVAVSTATAATGASLVPVTVMVSVLLLVAPWSSVTVKAATTSSVSPAARYWYAASLGSKL